MMIVYNRRADRQALQTLQVLLLLVLRLVLLPVVQVSSRCLMGDALPGSWGGR